MYPRHTLPYLTYSRIKLTLVLREKNCGWRIDVFYANEGMMKDVISSDVLSDVPLLKMVLILDHGLRSLSYLVDF